MTRFLMICTALLASGTAAFAQYTNVLDGGTNQIVNSVWSSNLPIIVGSTTSNNFLGIDVGGLVTNASGVIGNTAAASNNAVMVFSDDAAWVVAGDLLVGNGGAGNSLLITNGAQVASSNGYIGNSNTAQNNIVLVTGSGSSWTITNDFVVGNSGSANILNIINGAVVSNANGFVGAQAGSSNNIAVVAGSGANWINEETLTIGAAGNSSNVVAAVSGGTVTASNLVVHAGNDFNLNNQGTLAMTADFDYSEQTNLNWNSGGTLSVAGNLTGLDNLAVSNQYLTINGGTWTNAAANRTVGVDASGNSLTIKNGGRVENAEGIIGSTTNASGNAVLVTGTNSVWNNNGDLTVGASGAGNQLYIQNGGTVSNANAWVGRSDGASNNYVEVFGEGALWVNNGTLTVGAANATNNNITVLSGGTIKADGLNIESGNSFNLEDDGTLAMSGAFDASKSNFNWNAGGTLSVGGELSGLATTNGQSVLGGGKRLVLDGGSHSVTNDFVVGYESSNVSLSITNGGGAENANGFIGWGSNASHNAVLVADAGSAWTNSGDLYIGLYGDPTNLMTTGTGNSLTVSNGGWVHVGGVDTNLSAGSGGIAVANNSTVAISDNSTVLTEGLFIHTNGMVNLDGTLQVTGDFDANQIGFNWNDDATLTVNSNLTYSGDIGGSNKTLNVDGAAASWNAGTNLLVNGNGSTVNIKAGATVTAMHTTIGAGSNDVNNTVNVSGDSTTLNGGSQFTVGFSGSDNHLTINNGGTVENTHGYIGMDALASGNSVTVTGSNAVWRNTGDLYVGRDGSGNMLNIKDGALVESMNATIGSTGSSNSALVSGSNSIWRAGGTTVDGLENSLTVEKSGLVESDSVAIRGASNTLTVTGADSVWRNSNFFTTHGTSNTLSILDGGMVDTASTFMHGSGNTIRVDGPDSTFLSSGSISVGVLGEGGNRIVIQNGGRLIDTYGTVGNRASSNTVSVIGDGSVWENTFDLGVGGEDAFNTLQISSGGIVSNRNGDVGVSVSATNNVVTVSGPGSSWVNSGTLQIGKFGAIDNLVSVYGGGTVSASNLIIETGNSFSLSNNGTLAMTGDFDFSTDTNNLNWTSGGTLAIQADLQNTTEHNGNGLILAIDEGGTWTNDADHIIGNSASGSELEVRNGGYVLNNNGFVGATSNALNNSVIVSGSGSIWENQGMLQIGAFETNGASLNSGNSVTVKSQGTVIADTLEVAGGNSFNLNDSGTLSMTGGFNLSNYTNDTFNWNKGGRLSVGGILSGLDETETIVSGVTNNATFIDTEHIVNINGPAGRLSGNTNLIVGLDSADTRLEILDGGKVDNENGFIGWGKSSDRNSVWVSGAGSVWTNRENLYVGGYRTSNSWVNAGTSGGQNELKVENNAWVFVGDVVASNLPSASGGIAVAATNGSELVLGYGSLRTDSLYIGAGSNRTGTVEVRKEGAVYLDNLVIAGGSNNVFELAGSLVVTNGFDAGMAGFKWEDEGRITLQSGDLTGISGIEGTNRAVFLNSANWMTNTALLIGAYGSNNTLTVTGNSQLTSSGATMIGSSNAVNSVVTLGGSNVVWNNTGDLTVGNDGSGNSLTIKDGANFVNTGNAFI